METRSDRNRTLFGRSPSPSHEARRRRVATEVEPLAPVERPVHRVMAALAAPAMPGGRTARPTAGRTVKSEATRFEFNEMTDAVLLEWLTARGYRPNVLVECSRGATDTVARHLMTWCALPFRFSALPGTLELPEIQRGTLLLKDVATLTLSQQVMLYDWLANGCGAMQVVSVTSAPLEVLVEDGEFLEGLFYRLNVIRLDGGRGTRPAPLSAWSDRRDTPA